MLVTIEIDPARRTAAFREVSYLAAGDSCHVVLDGVRGADFGTLKLMLYRDAASESPVASCTSFSAVPNHPSLADGVLALDTSEMAEWFADAVPEESDSDSDSVAPAASVSREPRLAARASLAERSVRAEGWLVAFDSDRVWAACRVPVLLRPGAGTSGASDPSSIRVLVSELVAGLVSAALADKADKAVPSAAGNLASLDASGNLADSGATPESIKAAAVAEVVANAPGTMDTLKEIADILGSTQQTGTVLEQILDLKSGKVDKVAGKGLSSEDFTAEEKQKLSSLSAQVPADWSQADSTAPDFIKNKPTIPAAVTVDATMTTQGAAADAKAVGDALRSGFTPWVCDSISEGYEFVKCEWRTEDLGGEDGWHAIINHNGPILDFYLVGLDEYATSFSGGSNPTIQISRHLITPTKTSQLTNDGAPNGGGTPYATTAQVVAKQDALSAQQLANIAAVPNKANATDLPYALVTPGEWEFSGLPNGVTVVAFEYEGSGNWYLSLSDGDYGFVSESEENILSAEIVTNNPITVTATRASLPGHLLDRAGNHVVVTGDTTLTLPAAVPGYLRDFLVRLEISGSTVPTITFSPDGNESVTYETDGDEFPVPDEAGNWLYSFTESCVAHKFAVSLKKVNEVAAPQAQGGS